jgi:hypothetical protein
MALADAALALAAAAAASEAALATPVSNCPFVTASVDVEPLASPVILYPPMGKAPVMAQDWPGFVVNRILCPMINEAIQALMEGVGDVAAIDAGLAAQNAVVAAESMGLATVYIGALRNDVPRVAAMLGLPPGAAPVFGLCVGYAAPGKESAVKPRLSQEAVLHHETYSTAKEKSLRASYDEKLAEYSKRYEMAADNWSQRVISRIGSISALRGRDGLKAALRSLGFPLK